MFLLLFSGLAGAQQKKGTAALPDTARAGDLATQLASYVGRMPLERLFVHIDKPYYTKGDTIWFKAYLTGDDNTATSTRSGILYLELVSPKLKIIKRISVPLTIGLGWGQIALEGGTFPEGQYVLRAYTNWMQNFGQEAFFTRTIALNAPGDGHWMATLRHAIDKQQLRFSADLSTLSGEAVQPGELSWELSQGDKVLEKQTLDLKDGKIEGAASLPASAEGDLVLTIARKNAAGVLEPRLRLPLRVARAEKTDIQFLPEGGYLVAGLPARVAFKALDEDGSPTAIEGQITDNEGNAVSFLNTVHDGMGLAIFSPEAGQRYTARVKLPGGSSVERPLPEVKTEGTVMAVNYAPLADSLRVQLSFSPSMVGRSFTLSAVSRGKVMYALTFRPKGQQALLRVPTASFATGITHLTLFDEQNRVLNERLTFIEHRDQLVIGSDAPSKPFKTLDSIPLSFRVSDASGKPVQASFSVSVTDDSRIAADTLEHTLLSQLLLQSELNGAIYHPAYYFTGTAESGYARDLLLLTQGWRAYDWKNVFRKTTVKPSFAVEREREVKGQVTNVAGKPVANSAVDLMVKSGGTFVANALTDSLGRFRFAGLPLTDSLEAFLQSKNKNGRRFNVGIAVERFRPALPPDSLPALRRPWYMNIDTLEKEAIRKEIKDKRIVERITGGNLLNEIVLTGKKSIKNSKNLNGAGGSDIALDEEEVQSNIGDEFYSSILSLIPNMRAKPTPLGPPLFYMGYKEVFFVVDGVPLKRVWQQSDSIGMDYPTSLSVRLGSLEPRDIVGIEVMKSAKYLNEYISYFSMSDFMHFVAQPPPDLIDNAFVFVEITTRSGKGLLAPMTIGTQIYKAFPFTLPAQFYSPRYNRPTALPDTRSTIFWEPNLVSDKVSGKGATGFYAGDQPGNYTVVIQGTDLNGRLGYRRFKLKIENR